jgi:hypothetical protein
MYQNISYILSCYFHQDSDLEFDDPMDIIDTIVDSFKDGDRFSPAINELSKLLISDRNIDDEFMFSIGLDASPYGNDEENRLFLESLRDRMMKNT